MDPKTFADHLRDCGLLFDRRLDKALRELVDTVPDGKTLAKELIKRGLLTAYQANHILTGKGKELVLGQYRLVERLGQSISGNSYKAVHATMGRLVVIRLLNPSFAADPASRGRFTNEVQNIAQLSHTNILTAFDAFEVNGMYVLVMEFVEGMDLASLIQHVGPLPAQLASNFMRQTALGMQHAYERGIRFCNIKPENILIAGYQATGGKPDSSGGSSAVPRGVVKLLNIGLAELTDGPPVVMNSKSPARGGAVITPPDYLAPEVTLNQRSADIRSDLYTLGCILYFVLAGRTPFPDGTAAEKILAQRSKEPEPVETIRADIPAKLGQVVRRMMAKKPTDRYQSPAELANDLTPFCVSAAVTLKP